MAEVAGNADQAKASTEQANQLAQQNQSAVAANAASLAATDKTCFRAVS